MADVRRRIHENAAAAAAASLAINASDGKIRSTIAAGGGHTNLLLAHKNDAAERLKLRQANLIHSSYPVRFVANASRNRVQMLVKNGLVVRASADTHDVLTGLLGFAAGDYAGNAASSTSNAALVLASDVAQLDKGNRAMFVHASICTGSYGPDGKGGSSCIGSFPIDVAPGQVISYAPTSEPYAARAPLAGALVDRIRWELRGDDAALANLQGEDWQCLGVLSWDE